MAYRSFPPLLVLLLSLSLPACTTDTLTPSARFEDVGGAEPEMGDTNGAIVAYPSVPAQAAPQPPSSGVLIPPGGVDMDAMLGVADAPVTGLAEAQAMEIAEVNASQPVVGGIGEETVRQLSGPAGGVMTAPASPAYDPDLPPLSPERIAEQEAQRTRMIEEQRAMILRADQRRQEQEEQVAFLPRADNPVADAPVSRPEAPDVMPTSEIACRKRLKAIGVEFRDVPRVGNGRSCGIDYPVKLTGLSGGIDIKPSVTLNCAITEAFALWVKKELAPSARARYLSGVKSIRPMGGYSCRTMNSKRGNPMSEHARGNAIDIGTFVLNSGKEIDIRKKGFFAFREKGLLKAVRGDSCKYFTTVLGPGSDPYHKDHFHFDLRTHRGSYRHCD